VWSISGHRGMSHNHVPQSANWSWARVPTERTGKTKSIKYSCHCPCTKSNGTRKSIKYSGHCLCTQSNATVQRLPQNKSCADNASKTLTFECLPVVTVSALCSFDALKLTGWTTGPQNLVPLFPRGFLLQQDNVPRRASRKTWKKGHRSRSDQ